jgi:hypothetical protein
MGLCLRGRCAIIEKWRDNVSSLAITAATPEPNRSAQNVNNANELIMEKTIDRVQFMWLFLIGLLGSLIGVPYTIAVLMDPAVGGPVDPQMVWLSAIVEAIFFLAPASAIGIWMGKQVGLGSKLLSIFVKQESVNWKTLRPHFYVGLIVGMVLGVVGSIQNTLPKGALGAGLDNPSNFEYLLRCMSAAITEEILFRLGLVTLFVWIMRKIVKKPALNVLALWVGSLVSSLLFAVAHLPNLLAFGSAGSRLVLIIVVFSTVAGLVMSWLYIRYSLVSAMIAHFIGDAIVYVLPRMLAMG